MSRISNPDYSIFDVEFKEVRSMFGMNPSLKERTSQYINFNIVRHNTRNIKISIHKEESLWVLYETCYYAVYPHMRKEQSNSIRDTIPNPIEEIPVIYDIFMHNEKNDTLKSIPKHEFITIDSFIKCNESYFGNTSILYVVDEKVMQHILAPEKSSNSFSSFIKDNLARYNCLGHR